jgi:histidine ammonia-lyase
MSRDDRRRCPPWCVADHDAEDDAGTPARHRSETVVVPGISIRSEARRTVESIEILIEVHTEEGDPVVGVYVGDGTRTGLDITTETAERLHRRLGDALRMVGVGHPSAAPKSRPST